VRETVLFHPQSVSLYFSTLEVNDVSCLAAHPHANITAVGHSRGTLAQDTKGTNKQITLNKGTSLHDVLYRRPDRLQHARDL
jgi:phage head maturation protease